MKKSPDLRPEGDKLGVVLSSHPALNLDLLSCEVSAVICQG